MDDSKKGVRASGAFFSFAEIFCRSETKGKDWGFDNPNLFVSPILADVTKIHTLK